MHCIRRMRNETFELGLIKGKRAVKNIRNYTGNMVDKLEVPIREHAARATTILGNMQLGRQPY